MRALLAILGGCVIGLLYDVVHIPFYVGMILAVIWGLAVSITSITFS